MAKPLSILFRRSFTSGLIPSDWKNAFVRLVYKKGDKFDPGNYRPVSLTSIVVKVMESVIYV